MGCWLGMGKVWEWFWLGTNAGPYELEISHRSVKSLMKLSQLKLPIHKTSSFSYALIENIHTMFNKLTLFEYQAIKLTKKVT